MSISVDESDVREVLDGEASTDYDIEVRMAEAIVNDELAPYADSSVSDDRLELVGALLAAAYYEDDGNGPLLSVRQGSAQVSYTQASEDTLTYFKRAAQMDPTDRIPEIDKPTASLSVPDVR